VRAVLAVTLALLFGVRPANAQVMVGVELSDEGNMLASGLGVTPAELARQIQDAINVAYGASEVDDYLRSFADATAFSMRGLGVDYASDPESLILGIGINAAVAASEQVSASQRPTAGLAPNVAFMAGLNLSSQGAPRWTLFGNGFYRRASTNSLRGGITSAGIHAQYRIANPQRELGARTKALRWIGIDVTGGLEFTRWNLGVRDEIVSGFDVNGTSASAQLILEMRGMFDLKSTAVTIPIEVTTGVRIAMLLSVYVGAGLDVTSGTGKLSAELGGPLYASNGQGLGTASITGGGENSASVFATRVLAGAQLNLWKLKVYAQVNGSPLPAANVGFGIRGVL
jgi:hypothetical protein